MFWPKVLRLACAIFVTGLLVTIGGCGGIQQPAPVAVQSPPPVGSPTPPSPQTQEFVYHLSPPGTDRTGLIEGFALDETTGLLTSLSATTLPAGTFPDSLAADPSAKFLFLSTSDISQSVARNFVVTYKIDSTMGMLTQTASTDTAGGGGMVLDPTNQFLYMPGFFAGDIAGFQLHGDGSLGEIPGSPFVSITATGRFAMNPAGTLLYSVFQPDRGEGGIQVSLRAPSGILSSAQVTGRNASTHDMALHPAGSFLLATYDSLPLAESELVVYRVAADGTLNPTPDSPRKMPRLPPTGALTVDSGGKFILMLSEDASGTITRSSFSFDAMAGTLSALPTSTSTLPPGQIPLLARWSATGNYFIDEEQDSTGSTKLYVYRLDHTNGQLARVGNPYSVAGAPGDMVTVRLEK